MNHIVLSSQNKTTIDSLRKELETELDDDMEVLSLMDVILIFKN